MFQFRRFFGDNCALSAINEYSRDRQVTEGDCWCLGQPNLLAVDKAEEREHRSGRCESCCLHEFSLDNKHADRAKHQSGQDRPSPQYFQPMIKYAGLCQLIQSYCSCAGSRRRQRIVDLELAPRG